MLFSWPAMALPCLPVLERSCMVPLFLTNSEFAREHVNVDGIVSKADAFIGRLQEQVETHKTRADATAINAEQRCALIEQKFLFLSGQFSQLENEKEQSFATLERRSTDLAQAQGLIHKLEIEAIKLKHHSAIERLSTEVGELSKAKRELLEAIEQKNSELDEKNASIKILSQQSGTLYNPSCFRNFCDEIVEIHAAYIAHNLLMKWFGEDSICCLRRRILGASWRVFAHATNKLVKA